MQPSDVCHACLSTYLLHCTSKQDSGVALHFPSIPVSSDGAHYHSQARSNCQAICLTLQASTPQRAWWRWTLVLVRAQQRVGQSINAHHQCSCCVYLFNLCLWCLAKMLQEHCSLGMQAQYGAEQSRESAAAIPDAATSSTQQSTAGLHPGATAASPAAEPDVYAAQSSSQASDATSLQPVGPCDVIVLEDGSGSIPQCLGAYNFHMTSNLMWCCTLSTSIVKCTPNAICVHDDRLLCMHCSTSHSSG